MADISTSLCEQVQDARADNTPLNLIGGNTKTFIGREATGRPVSLTGHSGVTAYHPSELVITARAGTRITELQSVLAEHNQMLVGEPPAFEGKATLGGSIACNISGASRPFYGSLRDAILGVTLINGFGEPLRFGGQVMKNVAGYDLSRLQAGAMGAFGILTDISLRVMPKPESVETLVLKMDTPQAITFMRQRVSSGYPLSGAAWVDGHLYIRLAGTAPNVGYYSRKLGGESLPHQSLFWRSIRNFRHPFFSHNGHLYRLSIDAAAPHFTRFENTLVDWAGNIRWVVTDENHESISELAKNNGGHVARYRSKSFGNRQKDNHNGECFQTLSPAHQRLHKSLKAAFDPQNLFNSGRLYSWLGSESQ
ncbi:glycolate oxidase subunit GlcE [Enterovibrio sp. ZSDZ42]|uniref:Glycolate oxidase subunit GlcE n=1 Tax=Enterovibrio gelatinilyticus TaxID=2899819 RepID=A0ABT5QYX2_9GAMM|nr:glycolate oxidase subunit GlcE [Enterovibrio sp. ZSDZ42]MDD1793201.1 glycolate oxidase subunit GlcE [Enterovibrio sp. ZSDZ42]